MVKSMQELNSKIDAGLELISALGAVELKPIEIRDLLYNLISKDYNKIDEILETAQKEKLLQRTEKTFLITPEASNLQFEKPKSHTYGPYGSSCIRKIYLDHLL